MAQILLIIATLCGPRVQSTTIDNTSGTFVNGYANQAAKTCTLSLLTCVQNSTAKNEEKALEQCLAAGN